MDDAAFYRERGFGGTAGFGRRPALLVIDLVNGRTNGNGRTAETDEPDETVAAEFLRQLPVQRGS
jgi:hypothetical protein